MTDDQTKDNESKKPPKARRPGGKSKRIAIRTALILFALLLPALALLAGCKSEPSITGPKTGYLHSNDDSAQFVEWEQAGQKLKGDIKVWSRKPDGELGLSVFLFYGELNGEKVRLTLNSAKTSEDGFHNMDKTIIGALGGNTLTLPPVDGPDGAEPLVFRRARNVEFFDAYQKLYRRAETKKTAK